MTSSPMARGSVRRHKESQKVTALIKGGFMMDFNAISIQNAKRESNSEDVPS